MYNYEKEKKKLFTEQGQVLFLEVRDRVKKLLKEAGAFRLFEATKGIITDSWDGLICVDRLVELGEIKELTNNDVVTQYRVFISTND